jgi:hypothetical protein
MHIKKTQMQESRDLKQLIKANSRQNRPKDFKCSWVKM